MHCSTILFSLSIYWQIWHLSLSFNITTSYHHAVLVHHKSSKKLGQCIFMWQNLHHTPLGQVCSVYSNSMDTSHLCSNGALSPWHISCQHPSGAGLSRGFLCPVATSPATGTPHDSYPPGRVLKWQPEKGRKSLYFSTPHLKITEPNLVYKRLTYTVYVQK